MIRVSLLLISLILLSTSSLKAWGFWAHQRINRLAEQSPGFVWRLQDESGDATDLRMLDDEPELLVNLTVWQDLDSFQNYVYRTEHAQFMRRRREWFEKMERPVMALWWIPAGHIPDLSEAREKYLLLEKQGPSAEVFTARKSFSPSGLPYK